ncbi:MAG: Prolipoprotein diacylglyceryl transferase [Candidatus Gottesmanbacteria bacterium GW2011_GWB1_49_7]|uniref:Prolipoprotein diacylglyceryl transferase n=1 Tax=Candidatus Gottesmanbacteria bacterium GW2011_GWB1_49_7 TaxID=1618448 RepID=A0A0G1VZ75_9BACT|nr:MAG: Prolipoprotein diacylglyceryl transferase [Candidatus Gottesmanbacteria bacterium GW2011_GWB1_49_7]
MFPVLFSIGSLHIYSFSILLVLSWLVFSFVFWRELRNQGVEEDRIFDLTFYATIAALVFSRAGFVLFHWEAFADSVLKIAAIWVVPGLSLYGAIVGGLITLVYLSRRYKVRLGHVLDACAPSLGGAFLVGVLGAFLDGSYVGTMTNLPWATRYVGWVGTRHPIQLYEAIAMAGMLIAFAFLARRGKKNKWPYGLAGLWFFSLFAVSMFVLEFLKDSPVYWGMLRANQWILVALFAEDLGAFYVRGGGREAIRPFINNVLGGIYGKFSKRST